VKRLAVIGAGPAGLICAGAAARRGIDTTVFERNDRPARKLLLTGKGRCNVTNNRTDIEGLIENVPVNGRFLYSAFSAFMPADTMALFERLGVKLKTERGDRVFPVSDKAADIADALVRYAREGGARFEKALVTGIEIRDGALAGVLADDGRRFAADCAVLATGGISYPSTGSDGTGYAVAKQAGHTIVEPKPSLVGLELHEGFCSELSGLSLKNVELELIDSRTGKTVYAERGEMLFTHFGVSGPLVLSASSHIRRMEARRYHLLLDLKPALTLETLDARLLREFSGNLNRNFINALNGLMPKALVPVIVRLSGIKPSQKVNQITKEQRSALARLLKNIEMTVTAFRPVEEAVITSGGVDTSQVNPKTMESKLVKGLYFAGEVLDVDAYTGGFNLQIAFSTGYLAGISVCAR